MTLRSLYVLLLFALGLSACRVHTPHTATEPLDYTIAFAPDPNQTYGFDASKYDQSKNLPAGKAGQKLNETDYWVAWKSIASGRTDYTIATTDKEKFPAYIGFKTPTVPLSAQQGDKENAKRVSIIGTTHGTTQQLKAYAIQKEEKDEDGKDDKEVEEKEVTLGLLNVVSYDQVRNKVIVVPVNGVTAPSAAVLSMQLNAIYGQAVAEWEVVVDERFTIDDPDLIKNLDEGESGIAASFPANMREFNRKFKRSRNVDKDAYYLFLVNGVSTSKEGFMPFKRQYGYIFNNDDVKTIAHELGHGAFRLRHTFSPEAFIANQGSTDNLMDYSPAGAGASGSNTKLYKHQWDNVHNPEKMIGWFQDDAESASYSKDTKEYVIELLQSFHCAKMKEGNFQYYNMNDVGSFGVGFFKWFSEIDEKQLLDEIDIREVIVEGATKKVLNVSKEVPTVSSFTSTLHINNSPGPGADASTTYQTVDLKILGNDNARIRIVLNYVNGANDNNKAKKLLNLFQNNPFKSQSYYANKAKSIMAQLNAGNEVAVMTYLSSVPECVYEHFSAQVIVKLANLLIEDEAIADVEIETMLVKLFDYAANPKGLVSQLKSNSELLPDLFAAIDNVSTRKAFLRSLIKIGQGYWTGKEKETSVNINKTGSFLTTYKPDYEFLKDGQLVINSTETTVSLSPSGISNQFYINSTSNTIEVFNGDPFAPIVLWNGRAHEDIGQSAIFTLRQVPAVVAAFYIDIEQDEDFWNGVETTVDLALLAVGAGEAAIAIKGLYQTYQTASKAQKLIQYARLTLALADNAAAITDIACKQNPNSELCKEWAEISFYVNIGLLTGSSLDLVSSAMTKADDLVKVASKGDDLASLISKFKGNIPEFYNSAVRAGLKVEKSGDIVKVYAKNGTDVLAELSERSLKIKYSGWGGDIVTGSDKTTTCIAKFDDQLDAPGSQFIKNDLPYGGFMRGEPNPGGVNILDVDDETYLALRDEAEILLKSRGKSYIDTDITREADEIFWTRYNLPFLEDAFRRGDDIRLLSEPDNLFSSTGFYGREIDVISRGWNKADGTVLEPLMKIYNYSYSEVTKTYTKIE